MKNKKQTRQDILNQWLAEVERLVPAGVGFKYEIENAPIYGGYRLVKVRLDNGGHFGAFGGNGCEPRVKFDAMLTKLQAIIETAKLLKAA